MSDKGMSKEITDAWAEFIKNSDKAKEDILSAFDDDMEGDGGMRNVILLGVGTLACILVAFSVDFCIKAIMKRKENVITKKKKTAVMKKKN